MKKILILANNSGGLYGFRKELIAELCRNGQVVASTPFDDHVQELEALGCRLVRTEFERRGMNPLQDLRLVATYWKLLRRERPDMVLTYTIKPNIYGGLVCRMAGVPYAANITGMGTAIENGGLLSFLATKLYAIGLRKARCVFFQNKSNQELFADKRIYKGKSRLLPGSGVNTQVHTFEAYPDETDGIRLLFVGRLMRDKGINELLEAIRLIRADEQNVTLGIVGGYEEDYTDRLADLEAKGYIHYYGNQTDVHPFYTNCHCCVMPSYHEGMSNVLLEASSTGRPVIATRVPGCRETFEEGVSGFGCEAKSAESLANAIRTFLKLSQEQHARMGVAARKKMEREFDRSIVVQAYIEEIEEATGGCSGVGIAKNRGQEKKK